jgi:hypothetical protein
LLLAACQQGLAPSLEMAAPRDLATPTDLAAPDLARPLDFAPAADLAQLPGLPDLAPPLNPVSLCPVPPMDQTYTGLLPPDPYAASPPAGACVSAAHDVIIVLGCPNNSDGTPATCQISRADIAVSLMNAGLGSRFITSGAAVHNQYVEADTLRQLLMDRGVSSSQIWIEPLAQHTDENIYYSTLIMQAQGWTNALVVSEDAGQLVMTTLCDSNCCVDLGRLTVLDFSLPSGTQKVGHYVRYPWAIPVSGAECSLIESPLKAMCTNLSSRRSCAGNLQLSPPDGG